MKKIVFSDAQRETILTMYESGHTGHYIAEVMGWSSNGPVYQLLRREGVLRGIGQGGRKYTLNERIFENVDNHKKAYWLGYIFSDGYVDEKATNLAYHIHIQDIEHLAKMSRFFSCKKEPRITKGGRVVIRFHSRALVEDLVNLGAHQGKSLDIRLPDIDNRLIPHFLLGYFDGDGYFAPEKGLWRMEFASGSEKFLWDVEEFLYNLGFPQKKIHNNGGCNYLRYDGRHGKRLAWFLYDKHLALPRKLGRLAEGLI